jgi:cob(I)alamin adenosyltransferase
MAQRFYTRTGDDGTTGLLGEGRIAKSDLRVDALGTIDEANAAVGLARAACQSIEARGSLVQIQRDLYGIMTEVAATEENTERFRSIGAERVEWLETLINRLSETVEPPREFIVPGDCPAGAALDLARTVTRRAERRLVELNQREKLPNPALLSYLNRLSSFCFVLELRENQLAGSERPTLARG